MVHGFDASGSDVAGRTDLHWDTHFDNLSHVVFVEVATVAEAIGTEVDHLLSVRLLENLCAVQSDLHSLFLSSFQLLLIFFGEVALARVSTQVDATKSLSHLFFFGGCVIAVPFFSEVQVQSDGLRKCFDRPFSFHAEKESAFDSFELLFSLDDSI